MAARTTYRYTYRLPEDRSAVFPHSALTVRDNVANRLAREFYMSHGTISVDPAVEVSGAKPLMEIPVMTTRYCLRKEMGKCLKEIGVKDWKEPLYLVSGNTRLRLEFDCKSCRMNIYSI